MIVSFSYLHWQPIIIIVRKPWHFEFAKIQWKEQFYDLLLDKELIYQKIPKLNF